MGDFKSGWKPNGPRETEPLSSSAATGQTCPDAPADLTRRAASAPPCPEMPPPGPPPRPKPPVPKAPHSDASALMAWVLAGKCAAERRGIDAEALLREVGLDLHTRPDPMSRHSAARGLAFWQLAMRAADDELMGVDVALQSVPMTLNAQ